VAPVNRLEGNLRLLLYHYLTRRITVLCFLLKQRHPYRYKECTGKSIERLEAEKAEKAALEGQARAQAQANSSLAKQLADAQDAGAVAQSLADAWASENAILRNKAQTLSAALAASEARIVDLEAVRRKLHNAIMVRDEKNRRTDTSRN
jgi:hypothetical protein